MAAVVAAAGVPWILMHWRGPSARMNELAGYAGRARRGARRAGGPGRRRGAGRGRPGPAGARPRAGLRQDRRAQLGAAAPARRADRARLPGAGRRLPQAVPRRAAGRRRRHRRARCPAATSPPRRSARWPRSAGAWGVRVHDVDVQPGRGGGGRRLAARRVPGPGAPGSRGDAAGRGPDRAARAERARPPRRVRPRAARRAGLRRRPHGVAGPGRRGGLRRRWPTPSTTARWPSGRRRSSAASRAT